MKIANRKSPMILELPSERKTMSKKLKPVRCGCGGEAVIYINGARQAKIYCEKCGIESNVFATKYEAIEAWNKAMGERTAKAEYSNIDGEYLCKACGRVVQIEDVYCCGCGARLEWK